MRRRAESDDGLMVSFSLLALACVEGAAERVGEGAEGGLVEDALEAVVGVARPLVVASLAGLAQHGGEAGGGGEGGGGAEAGDVACLGEELGGEDDPHPGQAADEGPVRVGLDELVEPAVDGGDAAAAGDGLVGHLAHEAGGDVLGGEPQLRMGEGCGEGGLGEGVRVAGALGAQEACDGLRSCGADLGGGDVSGQQQERPGIGEVEGALEVWVDGVEQVAHAADAAGLVDHQIAAAADQEAEFDDRLVLGGDGAEVGGAQAELVGDDAGVLGIALGLAADAALAGAVDGEAGDVDEALAGGQQHGAEQGGDAAEQVDAEQALAAECGQLGGELADVVCGIEDLAVEQDAALRGDRGGPVDLLGGIDADADLHDLLRSVAPPMQRPLLAGNALNSDRSHRVISGRAKVARRAAMPPEPWRAARMIAIPASPPRDDPGMPGSSRQHRNNGEPRVRAE